MPEKTQPHYIFFIELKNDGKRESYCGRVYSSSFAPDPQPDQTKLISSFSDIDNIGVLAARLASEFSGTEPGLDLFLTIQHEIRDGQTIRKPVSDEILKKLSRMYIELRSQAIPAD